MITPKESPGRAVLERVANDYRRRGYTVMVEPRGHDLPEFLRDATPDLIAQNSSEHIVIEVKRSPHDVDREQLNLLSQRIASQPAWRFVVMADGPDSHPESAEATLLDEQSIKNRFKEANVLLELGHPEAALLLAWGSVEALLRLLATREGAPSPRTDPAALLRTAASEGLVNKEEFASLNQAFRLRSVLVHGLRPSSIDSAVEANRVTQSLSRISESLLAELRESA
jgi:HEPN domain-containing protein